MELAESVLDGHLTRRLERAGWTVSSRGLTEIPLRVPHDPDTWMAYSLLVRLIRLADREVTLAEVVR